LHSTIVVFAVSFAALGLLLGYAASYDTPVEDGRVLELTTDKSEYEPGETVTFTATNLGSDTLIFPGSALGMLIENLDTGATYRLIGTEALTPIEPGQSIQVEWQDTAEAESGNYVATIHTAAGESVVVTAKVNFRIT
jgi:archaellum component FlaG (FlaF/FlaG flagellin family)